MKKLLALKEKLVKKVTAFIDKTEKVLGKLETKIVTVREDLVKAKVLLKGLEGNK